MNFYTLSEMARSSGYKPGDLVLFQFEGGVRRGGKWAGWRWKLRPNMEADRGIGVIERIEQIRDEDEPELAFPLYHIRVIRSSQINNFTARDGVINMLESDIHPFLTKYPDWRRSLSEDPMDSSKWLVFADWLEERGDPLGIQIRSLFQ